MGNAPFSTISSLLDSGSPAAITWLVVSVVIWIAIQCMLKAGPTSHICKKLHEVIPTFADAYPPTSVVFPCMMVWIPTAFSHMCPTRILRPPFPCRRGPMESVIPFLIPASNGLLEKNAFSEAPATYRTIFFTSLGSNIVSKDSFSFPAIADASPARSSLPNLGSPMENQQPSEFLARQIFQGGSHRRRVAQSESHYQHSA